MTDNVQTPDLEKQGQATMTMVKTYPLGPGEWVSVYLVTPSTVKLQEFYVATFKREGGPGIVYGIGISPRDAMHSALLEWDLIAGHDNNPFREVFIKYKVVCGGGE